MIDKIKTEVRQLLESGRIEGFLGLRNLTAWGRTFSPTAPTGRVGPRRPEAPGTAAIPEQAAYNDRPPISERNLRGVHPGLRRARFEDAFRREPAQRGKGRIRRYRLSAGTGRRLRVHEAFPDNCVAGQPAEARQFDSVARIDATGLEERFKSWLGEFAKCLKCYGCRTSARCATAPSAHWEAET